MVTPYEEKDQSQECPESGLFASLLEEASNEIGVKSSSLALHLGDIWPRNPDLTVQERKEFK
jgi:hypothetical protein